MSTDDNLKKIAEASAKLEAKTDYYGAKLLAWPYSWVVVAVVLLLAGLGAVSLIGALFGD